jgi:hypothetical protein
MDRSNPVLDGSRSRYGYAIVFACLLAGEGNACAVDSITSDELENLRVLFASGTESSPPRRNIVEEILNLATDELLPRRWKETNVL